VGCRTWCGRCVGNVGLCISVYLLSHPRPRASLWTKVKKVVPSGCLLSSSIRLTGSLTAGICACLIVLREIFQMTMMLLSKIKVTMLHYLNHKFCYIRKYVLFKFSLSLIALLFMRVFDLHYRYYYYFFLLFFLFFLVPSVVKIPRVKS